LRRYTKVRLGPSGAEEVLPMGDLTDYEQSWLAKLIPELKVGRCRFTVSNLELKARLVSALQTKM
jgi:hypothetical protein